MSSSNSRDTGASCQEKIPNRTEPHNNAEKNKQTVSSDSKGLARPWRVWKTVDQLLEAKESSDYRIALTDSVVEILKLWATAWAGQPEWANLLNKASFQKEIEESMAALYYLQEWRQRQTNTGRIQKFIAVDVCGGKGFFSLLLKYYASLYWNKGSDDNLPIVDCIVLIEKATSEDINWNHLHAIHPQLEQEQGIKMVEVLIWEDCDLYKYDNLFERIQNELQYPVALTGIHLCKLLSPSLLSLSNLLGREKCPYVCVAPCCLPRIARTNKKNQNQKQSTATPIRDDYYLNIYCYETAESRAKRLRTIAWRKAAKDRTRLCYICKTPDHLIYRCPTYLNITEQEEQQRLVNEYIAATPCWNCGKTGHFKPNCPGLGEKALVDPPAISINVSSVLQEENPMLSYCKLLTSGFDAGEQPSSNSVEGNALWSTRIIETGLTRAVNNMKKERQKSSANSNNWNSGRKSIFIVASSS